jgi:uncharacterized damage-inducible protein DinB
MKKFALAFVLGCLTLHGQTDPLEGLWQGYDGELGHVSRQLIALAEAIPQDKYTWRPGAGVRSTSEVFLHIADTNFWLLSLTGPPLPPEINRNFEKSTTDKAQVIDWLKRSLEAVKTAHAHETPADLQRRVKVVQKRTAPVDGIYLRILVHANEHMGQLVAYARVNGIVPPWSQPSAK